VTSKEGGGHMSARAALSSSRDLETDRSVSTERKGDGVSSTTGA